MYFSAFRIYIYSHYCFASVTASISAMYAAFVAVAAACGAPALMVAVAFGIFANLPISLTHYGNGAVTVGMTWWKLIGLW